MIRGGISIFKGRRVLLLQGPLGPFFSRLAFDLTQAGAVVSKIDFNGGDWAFSPWGSITFTGKASAWPAFFENVLNERRIDMVLLFGDCRPMHRVAHEIAAKRGIELGVFEEGYVRPDYITLERFGVNGHSQISRDPDFYFNTTPQEVLPSSEVGGSFWRAAEWAVLYYLASALLYPFFRHYQHHRPLTLWEGLPWLRGTWRKHFFAHKEKGIQKELATTQSRQFFLVALQVYNDAQVHVHSDFDSVAAFIQDVVSSFVQFAPPDTDLVIKHHPLDRGYHDHSKLISSLMRKHGVQERVRYIHDQHLPTLLEHARGVVLVNSTVGLSALHYGTPLMVCGSAIYDMQGLTYQGSLHTFWNEAQTMSMDRELYERFRNYLIENTQVNGSFYKRLNIAGSRAGLMWAKPVVNHKIADLAIINAVTN